MSAQKRVRELEDVARRAKLELDAVREQYAGNMEKAQERIGTLEEEVKVRDADIEDTVGKFRLLEARCKEEIDAHDATLATLRDLKTEMETTADEAKKSAERAGDAELRLEAAESRIRSLQEEAASAATAAREAKAVARGMRAELAAARASGAISSPAPGGGDGDSGGVGGGGGGGGGGAGNSGHVADSLYDASGISLDIDVSASGMSVGNDSMDADNLAHEALADDLRGMGATPPPVLAAGAAAAAGAGAGSPGKERRALLSSSPSSSAAAAATSTSRATTASMIYRRSSGPPPPEGFNFGFADMSSRFVVRKVRRVLGTHDCVMEVRFVCCLLSLFVCSPQVARQTWLIETIAAATVPAAATHHADRSARVFPLVPSPWSSSTKESAWRTRGRRSHVSRS